MIKHINRDNYYIQTNNPTETVLRAYGADSWLVSCGPTTMINCLAPLGYEVEVRSPTGKWTFQPEELVLDFLVDPRNRAKLNAIRPLPDNISKQEVPQYYPHVASVLFGATGQFEFVHNWDNLRTQLDRGYTAQLCLKEPGHYIAALDTYGSMVRYNDSWPQRFEDGNGFLRTLTKDEYEQNVKNFVIWYK